MNTRSGGAKRKSPSPAAVSEIGAALPADSSPRSNMDDVARVCGYSRATVSLALRNDRTIPEDTRRRIALAAKQLGYRPNPLVAALMSLQRKRLPAAGTTAGMAYLTSAERDNPWRIRSAYVRMFHGACERATDLGFRLEEFNLRGPGMSSTRMREILRARNIHAVIVAPLPHRDTTIDFDFSSLAVVGLGMSVQEPLMERVSNDHFQSAFLAVTKCLSLGYQRIGLVLNGEGSHRLEHRWLAGYRFAIEQNRVKSSLTVLMPELAQDVAAAIPEWIRQQQPDVVIIYSAEPELCRQIPSSIGLVSLGVDRKDDEVSGIYQNPELVGRLAVEHAISRLNTNSFGPLTESHLHSIAGTWVTGRTAPGLLQSKLPPKRVQTGLPA